MPFRFKMQKVLDFREQLEEEAKVQLAKVQQQLLRAQEQQEKIRTELRQSEDKYYDTSPLDNGQRWLLGQYIKGLHSEMATAALQVRMQSQLVEEARSILAQRAMERKLLDKLKERQKQHYDHEELLKEQRFNDEIATLRYKAPSF